jgi:hypothetical protein
MTLATVFAVVWIYVSEAQLAYLDYGYPPWRVKMDFIREGQVGTLAIMGDSAPNAGLLPSRLGPGVVNLALGGGTSIEMYYLAKRVVAAPHPPKAVIVSIGPSHFTGDPLFWANGVGYGLLSFSDIMEARARSRELGDTNLFGPTSPGDIDAILKGCLYAVRFPSYYFPSVLHARVFGRYQGNAALLRESQASRGHSYYGTANGAEGRDPEADIKVFAPLKILDDYFDRTLALFQSRNIPVYFIAMPHNEASARLYTPEMKQGFTDYLNHYAAKYPNFHVLGDLMPVYPSSDFGDPWHLNPQAAPVWSDHVAQMLNDARVPGGPYGKR